MGGAVSSGKNNNDFADNLIDGTHIRTPIVEQIFRAVDRAHYMVPEARYQAYRDVAWKKALLHMSAPCIYSEALEALELGEGLSFLNVGSGTGYFNTMVGLAVGPNGVNHGVEIHSSLIEYANSRVREFIEKSAAIDELEFCEPKFFCGNGLCLTNSGRVYDRIYCGAQVPVDYNNYFQQLLRVGGILVMPFRDKLLQIKRLGGGDYVEKSLLQVSFVQLISPQLPMEPSEEVPLPEVGPGSLQALCRGVVRAALRRSALRSRPELAPPPHRPPPVASQRCRRIRIPIYDNEGDLNLFSDLNELDGIIPAEGSRQMNALVRIVLSMEEYRDGRRGSGYASTPSVSASETPDDEEEQPRDLTDEEHNDMLENVLLNIHNRMNAWNGTASESSPSSNNAAPDDDDENASSFDDSDFDIDSFADIESNSDNEMSGATSPDGDRHTMNNEMQRYYTSDSGSETDSEERLERLMRQATFRKLRRARKSKRASALKKSFRPRSGLSTATAPDAATSTAMDSEKRAVEDSKKDLSTGADKTDDCGKVELNHSSDESDSTHGIPKKSTKTNDGLKNDITKNNCRNSAIIGDVENSENEKAGGSGTKKVNNGEKLDSGIGENSPGSSRTIEEAAFDNSEDYEDIEDEVANSAEAELQSRRRGRKRGYAPFHTKRDRSKPGSKIRDENRKAFSDMLQTMVHSLPLPLALRTYINFNRSFDRVLRKASPPDRRMSE